METTFDQRRRTLGLFLGPAALCVVLVIPSDLSPEEREKQRAERTKKRTEYRLKNEKALEAALQKPQVQRLNEITLQQQGVNGLTSPYVVAGLKLSKDGFALG